MDQSICPIEKYLLSVNAFWALSRSFIGFPGFWLEGKYLPGCVFWGRLSHIILKCLAISHVPQLQWPGLEVDHLPLYHFMPPAKVFLQHHG